MKTGWPGYGLDALCEGSAAHTIDVSNKADLMLLLKL